MPYQSINPATGKVLKTLKELTATQLEKSLHIAAASYTTWRQTSFTQRAAVAAKAAAILGVETCTEPPRTKVPAPLSMSQL